MIRSLLRSLVRWLVGRDSIWALLPASWQRRDYPRVQRAAVLAEQFSARCAVVFADRQVRSGPLAGLIYPDLHSVGSALYPKLVGSYEAELHPELERWMLRPPGLVLDIGFAEGYYLVGLGRRWPAARLVGFDISPDAHLACRRLADANGIATDRLILRQEADGRSLREFLPAPGLVICDCEGHEEVLFAADHLPLWAASDLLIEGHDFLRPGITDAVAARLQATHRVRLITTAPESTKLNFVADPAFAGFRPDERLRLLAEGRPAVMRWIVAEARQSTR